MNQKQKHELIKELVNEMAQADDREANPFQLMALNIEIIDKVNDLVKSEFVTNASEKELLERKKSLLKILDVVNKEANNNE